MRISDEQAVPAAGLTGLRAAVTGGGSGLGMATARQMAALGARVACLDLDPSAVEDPLIAIVCDVSDDASVRPAVAEAAERLEGIDVLVNNAGIGARGGVADNDDCVNPGTADTLWVQRLLDQAADPGAERAALEARQPIGLLVAAEEGPTAASTTGTALAVDGGMHGLRPHPRR